MDSVTVLFTFFVKKPKQITNKQTSVNTTVNFQKKKYI